MGSLEEAGQKMFPTSPDPIMIELDRLENRIKDKERELGLANNEIKALKMTEGMKDKVVVELSNELMKLDEKLRTTEKQLEDKNLEIKKLSNEKKDAMAAQFAAEAALRRVHAAQKDEAPVSVESPIGPLESKLNMYKNEIAALQEDNKALESITKSKEMALVEAEKILRGALERALVVENVQNQNFELRRQIEILQEENKLLDKTNRQKIVEIEKLAQTIHQLEESLLANGATTNALLEYQRKVSELNEEKKELERELAKVKVSANRVAAVVANEGKDGNDKVMPVKQWLDERKYLQGEINRLRDKLVVSERTAKADAQRKDKVRLSLKTLEEGTKNVNKITADSPHPSVGPKTRSLSQPRPASLHANRVLNNASSIRSVKRVNTPKAVSNARKNLVRKVSWTPRSKLSDDCGKVDEIVSEEVDISAGKKEDGCDDMVSGFLYKRLQKEVISLRKSQEVKDGMLIAKEDEIKMLLRKVDALTTKAKQSDSTKVKKEAAAKSRVKESEIVKKKNIQENINKRMSSNPKRTVKHHAASTNSNRRETTTVK
ncbi:hypothetical protein J5N97_008389 [Dioscorea zingiberensis]|uniref:Uncharacterized protein n=1 Tax=Dioscorea zingiberensis TaxID=325984 RepID=A0A9D5HKR6_9LILI|nr:hypothetical protein J5N97_008389 [Dioscorea zingiberensis]